jgi:hypothetical protein
MSPILPAHAKRRRDTPIGTLHATKEERVTPKWFMAIFQALPLNIALRRPIYVSRQKASFGRWSFKSARR